MNELQIFNNPEFGEIRTIVIDGEPWFAGKDVCKSLGYAKPTQAIHNNVDIEDTLRKGLLDSRGINQETIVVNESGLYSLIFGSKLDSAKKFKRWVTSEVLPAIRKTGTYNQPKLPQNPMEILELHYEAIKHVDRKVDNVSLELQDMKDDLENFKRDLPILGIEEEKITHAVKSKGVSVMGGKKSNAYQDRSIVNSVYRDIYGHLYRNFGVRSYKAIKRSQCDRAVEIIDKYELPLILEERIVNCNAQLNITLGQ